MTKNKLEKLFSKSKHYFNWCVKLHNNPLAHQNTPADYIASHDSEFIKIGRNMIILFECKQVTCKEGKGRLAFNRLKQYHDLLSFDSIKYNHLSYFVIAFWDGRWDKSEVYLVPIYYMGLTMHSTSKESINRDEAKEKFKAFELEIKGGELQFHKHL